VDRTPKRDRAIFARLFVLGQIDNLTLGLVEWTFGLVETWFGIQDEIELIVTRHFYLQRTRK
jgi:hypothetical protein